MYPSGTGAGAIGYLPNSHQAAVGVRTCAIASATRWMSGMCNR